MLWLIGIASMGGLAAGQASQTPPGPVFEVASVKPNRSDPGSVQRVGLQPGERVTMTNALKLEATRGAVDVLVIDHVEHPTEN